MSKKIDFIKSLEGLSAADLEAKSAKMSSVCKS